MRIKKNTKNGVCQIMRCSKMTPNRLCDLHTAEWEAAGKPELTSDAPEKPATGGAITEVSEERQQALASERASLAKALELANTLPLTTREQIEVGQKVQNNAHAIAKALKAEMGEGVDPLKGVIKKIQSWFKPNIEMAESIKKVLAARIGQAVYDLETARDAALAQIAQGAAEAPPEAFVAAHVDVTSPDSSGGITERVCVEVTSFAELPQVYKIEVVNMPVLQAAADAHPDITIPGVSITRVRMSRVGG